VDADFPAVMRARYFCSGALYENSRLLNLDAQGQTYEGMVQVAALDFLLEGKFLRSRSTILYNHD
jgi:hypothetical protein